MVTKVKKNVMNINPSLKPICATEIKRNRQSVYKT